MERLHTIEHSNTNSTKTTGEGRYLTDEEWHYLQHHIGMLWRDCVGGSLFFLAAGVGLGLLAFYETLNAGIYIWGIIAIYCLISSIVLAVFQGRKISKIALERERLMVKRNIRIFPFPTYLLPPYIRHINQTKGCEVRSEEAYILPHWSRFFDHLNPVDGDGCFDIEAEIYETRYTNYVISLSNGLSAGKETRRGLLDTLAMRRARAITWFLFCFTTVIFVGLIICVLFGLLPLGDSFLAFMANPVVKYGLPIPLLLSIPALYFWRQHKQALARIEAMYEAEGLPERGHAKNVGSAIDNASSDKSNHERSNVPSNEKRTS